MSRADQYFKLVKYFDSIVLPPLTKNDTHGCPSIARGAHGRPSIEINRTGRLNRMCKYIHNKNPEIGWKWTILKTNTFNDFYTEGLLSLPNSLGEIFIQTHPNLCEDTYYCKIFWQTKSLDNDLATKLQVHKIIVCAHTDASEDIFDGWAKFLIFKDFVQYLNIVISASNQLHSERLKNLFINSKK